MRFLNILLGVVLVILGGAWFLYFAGSTTSNQSLLTDGTYLGFVRLVKADEGTMQFDDATWLSGKEAENAAIAAGLCTEATRRECLPNDYFISNASQKSVTLPLNKNAQVFMLTIRAEEEGVVRRSIRLAEFEELIDDNVTHWNKLPYNITVRDGEVIMIEEVYVP